MVYKVNIECFESTHRASSAFQDMSFLAHREEIMTLVSNYNGSLSLANELVMNVVFYIYADFKTFQKELVNLL